MLKQPLKCPRSWDSRAVVCAHSSKGRLCSASGSCLRLLVQSVQIIVFFKMEESAPPLYWRSLTQKPGWVSGLVQSLCQELGFEPVQLFGRRWGHAAKLRRCQEGAATCQGAHWCWTLCIMLNHVLLWSPDTAHEHTAAFSLSSGCSQMPPSTKGEHFTTPSSSKEGFVAF